MPGNSALHHRHHYKVSYDDLIAKHETLNSLLQTSQNQEHHLLLKAILIGANELILRQDEMGVDFTIAIVALLDIASDELDQRSHY